MNPASATRVLVIGPYGVIGGAIADRLAASDAWQLYTASRRASAVSTRSGSSDVLGPAQPVRTIGMTVEIAAPTTSPATSQQILRHARRL